jgi:hypothetical protein
MSRYELGRLFFGVTSDREMKVVQRFAQDPEALLDEYDLTEEERRAVLEKDVRFIYEAGVPPLLVRMGANGFMRGLDTPTYKQLIAGAVQARD